MGTSDPTTLEIRPFPGDGAAADVLPVQPAAEHQPFYDGLRAGRLTLQACGRCHRSRFPLAPACPYCRGTTFAWQDLRPGGTVHSWVRYHRAYLPEWAELVPYAVLTVALDDGPLVIGRLVDDAEPAIGMAVRMIVERWSDGGHVLAFASSTGGQ